MKSLPQAKSRLWPASDGAAAHAELVQAMRADTLESIQGADPVARVVIIADRLTRSDGGLVIVQTSSGLNPAVAEGEAHARSRWPGDGVVAMVGDLPALHPAELADVLALAAGHPRSFVADASGTGTTLLAARPDARLEPAFGVGSAARHAVGAVPLAAGAGLRTDVDTGADLAVARALGLGPRTAAVLASRSA